MRTKLLVLLFCWVGMVGIKSGNACGKDKDENAVVLPVYERNGRMYVEIEQTYLGNGSRGRSRELRSPRSCRFRGG